MEKATITFLGTGNAIPTEKRSHTSVLYTYKNENILIDCGEGTQRQFKIAQISPSKLTAILITHWHGDHILGLPGLFQTLAMSEYNKTLRIYGPKGTKHFLNLINNLTGINIKLDVHEVHSGKIFENNDLIIETAPMSHGSPAVAYSISVKEKIRIKKDKLKKLKIHNSPLIGQLAKGKDVIFKNKKIKASQLTYKEKGKKVSFILDTAFNHNAVSLAKNSDLLISESTFLADSENGEKLSSEYKHLTAKQAAQIAKQSHSLSLILTHISQRYEHNPLLILKEAKKTFKNSRLANDFDVIIL